MKNVLQIGSDGDGGYLVPDEFERTLVEALHEDNFVRSLATVINTTSGDRTIPVVATHGTAQWLEENQAYPDAGDTFSKVSIGSYKLGTSIKVSDELINDAFFDIESYLAREFGRRIGAAEEEAFINGDGNKKPQGFMKASGVSTVRTAKATDISADEIIELFYALRAPYRKNAVWVMNDSTVKAIRRLKDNNGQYLWQPALTAGTPDIILNRPLYTSSFAPEIKANQPSVVFGDLSYYWIADRQGRSFKRLNELYAMQGQVGFMASQRVDGKLIVPEAVALLVQKAGN